MKGIAKLLLPGLLTATLLGMTACSESAEDDVSLLEAEAYLDVARLYRTQGQYRAALIETQNAMQAMPELADTRQLISQLYNDMGNFQSAVEVLEQLQAQQAGNIETILLLAETYLNIGNSNEALALLETLQPESDEHRVRRLWLIGNARSRNNDQTAAYEALQEAITIDPGHIMSLINLSMLEFQGGNEFGAQEFVDQAMAADPGNLDLLIWRGQLALYQERYADSEAAFFEALEIMGDYDLMTPKRLAVLRAIIVPLQMQQKDEEALQYSQIIAESPQGQLQNSFESAVSMFQSGDLERAQELIDNVLASAPDHAGSNILQGLMQYAQGNFQGAEDSLADLVNADSSSPEVIKVLAATHLRQNQPQRALSVLEQAATNYPDDSSLLAMIAISQQTMGNAEQAVETFNSALELDPESANLHFALASSYSALQRVEDSIEHLNHALELQNDFTQAKNALIDLYLNQNNVDAAANAVAEWLQQDDESVSNNVLAGRVAFRQGDLSGARQYFDTSLSLESSNADARLFLAAIDIEESNYSEAESHLLAVLENDPLNISALSGILTLGDASQTAATQISRVEDIADDLPSEFLPPLVLSQYFMNQGNLDDALVNARFAYDRNVNTLTQNALASVLVQQITLGMQQQDYASAREAVSYALELQPENLQFLVMGVGVEAQDGDFTAAQRHLDRIREVRPAGSIAGVEVEGDLRFIQEDYNAALTAYREAWDFEATPTVGAKLHRTFTELERDDDAFAFLEEWNSELADDPTANMLMGMRYQEQAQDAEAINRYEVAIVGQPDNIILLNNLAWLYQDSNPERAVELSTRAASLFPDNADVLDTHGWILLKQGRQDEAVQVLERAVQLAPDSEAIAEHLEQARQ